MNALWEKIKDKMRIGNEVLVVIEQGRAMELCDLLCRENGFTLVSMIANEEEGLETGTNCIYYVFAHRQGGYFVQAKAFLPKGAKSFASVSACVPTAAFYEREIKDLFGWFPEGHPDPKPMVFHENWPENHFPMRKNFDKATTPPFVHVPQKFDKVSGEGIFEVPVGPVHAGIIEPGHFRFSVDGETIVHLEPKLHFVHKGLEKMSEGMTLERCFYLSERISGDETFANSLAFCLAVERIAEVKVPDRAQFTRVIFAELERLTAHLGDLAGICLDVGYGFATFQFRLMRGWAYLLADALCGRRFLRSVNRPGGVRKDFIAGKEKQIIENVNKIRTELQETVQIIKSNGMFLDRLEHTGRLSTEVARDLNATGPGGRASGIDYDVRKAFPYAAYGSLTFEVPHHKYGDVNCRMNVKIEEAFAALDLMAQCVEKMWEGPIHADIGTLEPTRSGFGMTESPRGENVHWLMVGEGNTVYRYKVRTPSFCNWPALCRAVRGNILPDFPLINKSFNLSYAGNDL